MSGETQAQQSGWTTDTLHSHLADTMAGLEARCQLRFNEQHAQMLAVTEEIRKVATERDRMYIQRFDRGDERLKEYIGEVAEDISRTLASSIEHRNLLLSQMEQRFAVADHELRARIEQATRETRLVFEASEKAILKAETANEVRFQSVNEFREQLRDQAQLFMPRTETVALAERNAERINELSSAVVGLVPRVEIDGLAERTRERIDIMSRREPTYISRAELEAGLGRISDRVGDLATQAATFLTQAEAQAVILRGAERAQEVSEQMRSFCTRADMEAATGRNTERIQELTDRLNRSEGRGAGLNAGWVYLLAAIGAIGTAISLYVALKGG